MALTAVVALVALTGCSDARMAPSGGGTPPSGETGTTAPAERPVPARASTAQVAIVTATVTVPPTTTEPLDSTVASDTIVATAVGPEVIARTRPSPDGPIQERFANPIPSGAPLVFEVVDHEGDWLLVSLPVRPNGTRAWIAAGDVTLSRTRYRIEVDVSDHRLAVVESGRVVVDTPVGIGKGQTPTPIGSFYLIELLAPANPAGPYGPFAFGLSGYSETLASFNGGAGVIGIHGTNDPASLGRDSSHGCIRVDNEVISHLASFLPLGTPVVITP